MSIDKNRYSALGLDSEIETCHDGCPPHQSFSHHEPKARTACQVSLCPKFLVRPMTRLIERGGGGAKEEPPPGRSLPPPTGGVSFVSIGTGFD